MEHMANWITRKTALPLCLIAQVLVAICLPCPCQFAGTHRLHKGSPSIGPTLSAEESDDCCDLWSAAKKVCRKHNTAPANLRITTMAWTPIPAIPTLSQLRLFDCASSTTSDATPFDSGAPIFLRE